MAFSPSVLVEGSGAAQEPPCVLDAAAHDVLMRRLPHRRAERAHKIERTQLDLGGHRFQAQVLAAERAECVCARCTAITCASVST
jgi:hypothetical protein